MSLKVNDLVAVSSLNKGVMYGRVVSVDVKKAVVSVGGNIVHAERRHVTKIWDKPLIEKLIKSKIG
jgi:hypothetical protein